MLTVSVHLNRDVEASFPRVLVPRLDGAADAEVERQPDDVRSSGLRETRGLVHRTVVNDHGLQIDPERRKVYRRFVEIETAKAAEIFSTWRSQNAQV